MFASDKIVKMYSQVFAVRLTRHETSGQLLFLTVLVQSVYFTSLVAITVVALYHGPGEYWDG